MTTVDVTVPADTIDVVEVTTGAPGPRGPQGPPGEWTALTQTEYDALTPDPAVLYVIVGP